MTGRISPFLKRRMIQVFSRRIVNFQHSTHVGLKVKDAQNKIKYIIIYIYHDNTLNTIYIYISIYNMCMYVYIYLLYQVTCSLF